MFPNLKAEMARRDISTQELSNRTNIPYATLAPKLRGDKPLKFSEAEKIKEALGTALSLDVLFNTEVIDYVEV